MGKKVTMQQIADFLGVSKFVVSKTISGKQGVSKETRKKVLDAAAQLGYIVPNGFVEEQAWEVNDPNAYAVEERADSNIFLVIMQNVHVQTRESPYWGEIIDGIASSIEKNGYKMVLLSEIYTENIGRLVNLREFSGVITVGFVSTSILIEISKSGLPLVMIDHEDPLIPCDTIFSNNFDASFQLTNYLLGMGHTRIQFVGDIHYSRSFYERFNGVRACLKDKDIDNDFSSQLLNMKGENFHQQFYDWRSGQPERMLPTAFVCANDQIATTMICLLMEAGYKVPLDVSVTGFDNTKLSYTTFPTITTVNVAKKDMGKRSVEILVRRIHEKDAALEKIIILGNLVIRESTGKVKEIAVARKSEP